MGLVWWILGGRQRKAMSAGGAVTTPGTPQVDTPLVPAAAASAVAAGATAAAVVLQPTADRLDAAAWFAGGASVAPAVDPTTSADSPESTPRVIPSMMTTDSVAGAALLESGDGSADSPPSTGS